MICRGMAFVPADSIFQLHEDNNHMSSTSPNVLSPSCTPQDFQGVSTFMMRRSMSFSGMERCEEARLDDDMSDDGCALGEKKRRLNMEQVRALEKSFEFGNKLEPERKMQLARALGLQPRQIAIWFQNRRARWKTKQLEKDYDILKKQFEALKADNDALKTHNQKLQSQVLAMKNSLLTGVGGINLNNKENECCWSNGSDENSVIDVNHGTTGTASADHSPPYDPQPTNKNVNHGTTASMVPPISLTQLLQTSSSSRLLDLQCPKLDHTAQDEGFCNMFSGIEEQGPNFWPWPEQQHFH